MLWKARTEAIASVVLTVVLMTNAILDLIFTIAFMVYQVIQCYLIEHFVLFSYCSIFVDGALKFYHDTGFVPGPTSKFYIHFFERLDNRFASTVLDKAKGSKSQNQGQSGHHYYTPRIPYYPVIFRRLSCYLCALNCKNATIFSFPGAIPWWAYLRCLEMPVLVNLNTKVERIDFRDVSGELIAVWERGPDSKWFISWQHDIANTEPSMDTSNLLRDVQGRKPLALSTRGWLLFAKRRGFLNQEAAPSNCRAPWLSASDEDAMTEAFHELFNSSQGNVRD
jgi:hypothetical protein